MSKQLILKIILTTALGLATGLTTMHLLINQSISKRSMASENESSLTMQKLSLDMVSKNYFEIRLSNENLAEKQSEYSTVRATLYAYQDIPVGLKYKWNLEKGATTNSLLEGSLPFVRAGDSYDFEIAVQNYSHELQNHVSLFISGQINSHPIQRSTIIASRPEDSFEYVIQKAAEQRRQEPNNFKIQKLSNGQNLNDKFRLDKIIR